MEKASTTSVIWQRATLLLLGATVLLTYSHFVKFIPDGITGGILDGARNLAQGRGLVTNSINPAFLPYYKDLTLPLPYLWYPLVPWATSRFFIVLGAHPWCLLILPVMSYFLSALLLLELGRRLFGATNDRRVVAALPALHDRNQPAGELHRSGTGLSPDRRRARRVHRE